VQHQADDPAGCAKHTAKSLTDDGQRLTLAAGRL
jgi:hypothetical protein